MSLKFLAAALALTAATPNLAFAREAPGSFVVAAADAADAADDDADPVRALRRERAEAARDEIRALVFAPQFVMAHRAEIGLTDRQRDQIILDLQALQRQMIVQQDKMRGARQDLIAELRAEPSNEPRMLAALDAVLNTEREVKRLQLQALVRLRDGLTPAQRARLKELREAH